MRAKCIGIETIILNTELYGIYERKKLYLRENILFAYFVGGEGCDFAFIMQVEYYTKRESINKNIFLNFYIYTRTVEETKPAYSIGTKRNNIR